MPIKNKKLIKAAVLVIAAGLFLYWMTSPETTKTTIPEGTKKEGAQGESVKQRKIKYWRAPMDPTYIRDKPGKSPMGMDLIPVYEDEADGTDKNIIKIDPVTVQNMGVRTAKVAMGPLVSNIRTVGRVAYDEERVQHIHTKVAGWVETLYVNTAGEEVRKGQKLLSIYSPELVATQEEYRQALRYKRETSVSNFSDVRSGADDLIEATKRRLQLMDINASQIEALEKSGEIQKDMILYSPVSGIVIDKKVLEGMKVDQGTELYTLANVSKVWVMGSVYEYELPFVRTGMQAEITLPYEPGVTYAGEIAFIYPYLSPESRTVQVRMIFNNPRFKLKPDMYTDVVIKSKISDSTLLVPSEAVIRTGTRNVVIVALGGGKFLPKDVVLGPEGQGVVQVQSGLSEGDTVVTSGQFLIDSESSLKEAINKMMEAQTPQGPAGETTKKLAPNKAAATTPPGAEIPPLTSEQKQLMTKMTNAYIVMQKNLVAENSAGVHSEAEVVDGLNKQLKELDSEGKLKVLTGPIDTYLEGLLKGDLHKERDSFALFSRIMTAYIKGPGKSEGLSSGIKLYYCPMKKEPWLQRDKAVENPYLGKKMLTCGNEEKY